MTMLHVCSEVTHMLLNITTGVEPAFTNRPVFKIPTEYCCHFTNTYAHVVIIPTHVVILPSHVI